MNIGEAIQGLKTGKQGMRLPYCGDDVSIQMQIPDEHSKMTAPYLYVVSRFGKVPWGVTQIELLSESWILID